MNVNDFLIQDAFESKEEYQQRREVTLKLSPLHLNPIACVTLARMFITKVKLGVRYDDDVEVILANINV